MKDGSGTQRRAVQSWKNLVMSSAGGDYRGFLIHILERTREGKQFSKEHGMLREKNAAILKNLATVTALMQREDPFRRQILSTVATLFTKEELVRAGVPVTNKTLASARKHAKTRGAGSAVPKVMQPPKKRKISPAIKNSIVNFLAREEISRPAADRFVIKKGVSTPVRFFNDSKASTYRRYAYKFEPLMTTSYYDEFKGTPLHVSESTFNKYTPNFYKKAKRATDMCGICEDGKKCEKKLNRPNANLTPAEKEVLEAQVAGMQKIRRQLTFGSAYKNHRAAKNERKEEFHKDVWTILFSLTTKR